MWHALQSLGLARCTSPCTGWLSHSVLAPPTNSIGSDSSTGTGAGGDGGGQTLPLGRYRPPVLSHQQRESHVRALSQLLARDRGAEKAAGTGKRKRAENASTVRRRRGDGPTLLCQERVAAAVEALLDCFLPPTAPPPSPPSPPAVTAANRTEEAETLSAICLHLLSLRAAGEGSRCVLSPALDCLLMYFLSDLRTATEAAAAEATAEATWARCPGKRPKGQDKGGKGLPAPPAWVAALRSEMLARPAQYFLSFLTTQGRLAERQQHLFPAAKGAAAGTGTGGRRLHVPSTPGRGRKRVPRTPLAKPPVRPPQRWRRPFCSDSSDTESDSDTEESDGACSPDPARRGRCSAKKDKAATATTAAEPTFLSLALEMAAKAKREGGQKGSAASRQPSNKRARTQ